MRFDEVVLANLSSANLFCFIILLSSSQVHSQMWYSVLWSISVCMIVYFVTDLKKVANRIVFNLYFSIFYLTFFFVLIVWPFPILNGRTVKNGKKYASLLKYMTRVLGVKWELRNGDVLAKDRGAVIVANHQSTLDVVGLFNIWETIDKMTVIAKKSILYAGPLGVIAYFSGIILIDRSNPRSAYRQLEAAVDAFNKKIKIFFFTEGTRNFDNTKFLPFKKGAFTLAVAAQVPIIPVVYSPYYFIDRKNYIFNKGCAIIQCLEEVPTTGLTTDDVPELIERVRNLMLDAYKKLWDEVNPTAKLDNLSKPVKQ